MMLIAKVAEHMHCWSAPPAASADQSEATWLLGCHILDCELRLHGRPASSVTAAYPDAAINTPTEKNVEDQEGRSQIMSPRLQSN